MNVQKLSPRPRTVDTRQAPEPIGIPEGRRFDQSRKILILCHDFPPLNSVGALRPYNWLHTAKQAGFYPVVVSMGVDDSPTPPEESAAGVIIRAQSKTPSTALLRRAKSLVNRFTEHYTMLFDSKRGIYEQAAAYLQENQVSAIIACGEPFVLFRYAWLLAKRFNVPYVLDYRDEWTPDDLKSRLQRITTSWNAAFQRKYLASALFYSSVSDGLVKRIRSQSGCQTTGLTVANGVDLDLLRKARRPRQNRANFRLVYTGIVYDEKYVEIFRDGLKRFLSEVAPENFRVEFYGIDYSPNEGYRRLCALAAEHPGVVSIRPKVQPREALELQAGATALLSLLPGSQAQGIMGTKTYEYIASGRPTLVVPSVADRRTHLFPDKRYQIFALDAQELARELKALYQSHQAGCDLSTGITSAEVDSISRQRSSATLYSAIDQALQALPSQPCVRKSLHRGSAGVQSLTRRPQISLSPRAS